MQNILHKTKTNTVLIADLFTDTTITHVMTFFRTSTSIQAGLAWKMLISCWFLYYILSTLACKSVCLLIGLCKSLPARIYSYLGGTIFKVSTLK